MKPKAHNVKMVSSTFMTAFLKMLPNFILIDTARIGTALRQWLRARRGNADRNGG